MMFNPDFDFYNFDISLGIDMDFNGFYRRLMLSWNPVSKSANKTILR